MKAQIYAFNFMNIFERKICLCIVKKLNSQWIRRSITIHINSVYLKKTNRFTWFLLPRKESTRLNLISQSVYLKVPSNGHHSNFKTLNKVCKYKTTYSWTNLNKTLLKIKDIHTYCFCFVSAKTETSIFLLVFRTFYDKVVKH